MKLEELTGKKILIAGYGKEGKATERFLKKMAKPAEIDVVDEADGPDYLFRQTEYDLLIRTPGLHKNKISIPYTTATNIFFANCPAPVIGVTGTKGKSTTASLIHHLLQMNGRKSYLAGNIGVPALDILEAGIAKEDTVVLELSSYQLDDIKYSPHISVLLNLFPEHMNYHGDATTYYEAKKRIVAYAGPDDFLVYHSAYPQLRELAASLACRTVAFDGLPLPDIPFPLQGEHNRDNMRAAVAVAKLTGISEDEAVRSLGGFHPLPHRLEYVGSFMGVSFYDDAISTTPESTIAALKTLKHVSTLFLGGLDRGYDYTGLAKTVAEFKIPFLVLFPDSGKRIGEALAGQGGWRPTILETRDMSEAVIFAYRHAPKGTTCLLSTAAPSYSIWKNFEEKGDLFQKYVKNYAAK